MFKRSRLVVVVAAIGIVLMGQGCSSTTTTSNPSPSPSPVVGTSSKTDVSITGFAFVGSAVTINAKTTVVWTNNDSVPHTVTADDSSFDSGNIAPGASFSMTFNQAGTVAYHCKNHPTMHGKVIVQ